MGYHRHPVNNHDSAIYNANCTDSAWHSFEKEMENKLWQVNGLLLVSAILAGLTVGIGAYGQRYRHHPFTRYIFLGATALFSNIISIVISLSAGISSSVIPAHYYEFTRSAPALTAVCEPFQTSVLVITWALLVQNVLVNTSVVVAVDHREGPAVGPPWELLPQGALILYLGLTYMPDNVFAYKYHKSSLYRDSLLEVLPFILTLAKLVFKYYAVRTAKKSFAFGHNPRLVSGYMQQLPVRNPPPLLVMGEETRFVEKSRGYELKNNCAGLVTIDRVWKSLDAGQNSNSNINLLRAPTSQRLADLCLSFSLFKLLRCRFARYDLAYASTQNTSDFFWSLLLRDGEHADRVFGVIAYELSFLHDYYNTSLPISFSKCWLPILGIIISLCSICYCIALAVWIIKQILLRQSITTLYLAPQLQCPIRCNQGNKHAVVDFGSVLWDLVPLSMLLVFVVAAEVRDIATYICSNWTKVVLTCRLLPDNEQSPSRSNPPPETEKSLPTISKWTVHVLRCISKLMKHFWDERMGQCSILPPHLPRSTPVALVRHLLHLPDYKIKVEEAVKDSIINALRSSRNKNNRVLHLSNGTESLRRSGQVGESFLEVRACKSESVSVTILTWHIATSILEVKYPLQPKQQGSSSVPSDRHRNVATHLSRYCVYLVTCCPELLPDHDAWSKTLCEAVKKDAERALGLHYLSCRSASTLGYQELVNRLSPNPNSEQHKEVGKGVKRGTEELGKELAKINSKQVVNDGVKLGKKLAKINSREAAWKLLADFWSEMILYVAPSDNLKGHEEAIARGGELITLLWALLNHAGTVSRATGDAAGASAPGGTSSDGVV